MKHLKKLTMTLALLIMAAGGAWAQTENEVTVTPVTGKTNQWTFTMPASNIELQVEYFAESNLFLSKEALADKANIAVTAGDLGVQFDEDGKSANTITEGSAMTVTYNGTKKLLGVKVEKKAGNTYLKWDADQKKLVATEIPTTAIKVENSNEDVEWAGTYVVEKEVTINGKIILTNNVNLIIKDGAKLIVNRFINGKSKNLSIYSQAQKTGELVVNCSGDDAFFNLYTLEVHSAKVKATSPNDGGGGVYNTTTLNVYGGSLDAECTGSYGHGILLQAGGFMNIYGGEVKAVGKGSSNDYSYGITASSSSNVKVYGGKLWAECATNKALNNITLTKDAGYTSGTIKHSSDKLVWFDGVDADAKYVKVE